MDALRNELKTGQNTEGKFHAIKAQRMINGINNSLKSGKLDKYDTAVANALLRDLQNALSGK